jgi:RNA polymerase sigma factor (sigma-70 family)
LELEKLIEKCIAGERKSQKLFFETYSDLLYAVAMRYSKSTEESEDILLKAFLKIFEGLKQFQFINEAAFVGWLKKIAINEALMEKRKDLKTLYKVEWEDGGYDEIQMVDVEFSDDGLVEVVNSLPDGYRTVFLMYVVDGYSHKEIAATLEISENTSRSQFFKARKLLREKLGGKNERISGT